MENKIGSIVSVEFQRDFEYEKMLDTLKVDINNFLFMRLPDECTLKEMEETALQIHNIVVDCWNKKR